MTYVLSYGVLVFLVTFGVYPWFMANLPGRGFLLELPRPSFFSLFLQFSKVFPVYSLNVESEACYFALLARPGLYENEAR